MNYCWRFCQYVSTVNKKKRFIYARMCKLFDVNFDDFIFIDECTKEIKSYSNKVWYRFTKNQHGKIQRKSHNSNINWMVVKETLSWQSLKF